MVFSSSTYRALVGSYFILQAIRKYRFRVTIAVIKTISDERMRLRKHTKHTINACTKRALPSHSWNPIVLMQIMTSRNTSLN